MILCIDTHLASFFWMIWTLGKCLKYRSHDLYAQSHNFNRHINSRQCYRSKLHTKDAAQFIQFCIKSRYE